uniref:Transmembrane protein 254 n=1 Tax=Cyprinus carpio TaxID=7962 RepID=A0A8C2JJN6_CYPCA
RVSEQLRDRFHRCTSCNCGSAVIVFSLFQWTVFWPQDVPYGLLGPLGALAKYFVDYHYPVMYYGWFMTWVIHLFEALFICGGVPDALCALYELTVLMEYLN